MRHLLSKFWKNDGGFIISTEALFILTILILGLVAGWSALRGSLLQEYGETAEAVAGLNQSYFLGDTTNMQGGSGATQTFDSGASGNVPYTTTNGAAPLTGVGLGAGTVNTTVVAKVPAYVP